MNRSNCFDLFIFLKLEFLFHFFKALQLTHCDTRSGQGGSFFPPTGGICDNRLVRENNEKLNFKMAVYFLQILTVLQTASNGNKLLSF